ncbi:MAG: hypothetical protein ACRYFR_15315 [Janthinobacterium lividum]
METTLEKPETLLDVKAGSNLSSAMEQGKEGKPSKEKPGGVHPELSPASFSTYYTWRGHGVVNLNCGNGRINANSRVVASVSEYNTDPALNRFIGDATMAVYNVAPYNGGVVIKLYVGFNNAINVRVDVMVEP